VRRQQCPWLRLLGRPVVVLALLFLPGMVLAQETIAVQLDPVGDSGVSGTATLTAAGAVIPRLASVPAPSMLPVSGGAGS
jgi:hypothetical protein